MVGEVRTGRRITQLPVSSASWSMRHAGPGDITITLPLNAEDFAALERRYIGGLFPGPTVFPSTTLYPVEAVPVWAPGDGLVPELLAALDPVRCFLAVCEDDRVLEAGPIWSWQFQGETLTVSASGIESLFDHRVVMDAVPSALWSGTYSSMTLGTVAKRLVQLADNATGGDLPIVLPADVAGDSERTYNGFDLASVRERLDELRSVEDGPEIRFEPRLTEDRLGIEWVMRVGTDDAPEVVQAGADWVFDGRAPRGPVGALSVWRDGSALATRAIVTGEGSEDALLLAYAEAADVGEADLRDVGFPLVETVVAFPSVKKASTLGKHARATLRDNLRPWQTWSADVSASADDGAPLLGLYRPGDWASVWVPEVHPLLGLLGSTGVQRARVMEVSGGMGGTVTVTFAPTVDVR